MVFPILGANTESAEFDVSNSLRFNDGDSPKLQALLIQQDMVAFLAFVGVPCVLSIYPPDKPIIAELDISYSPEAELAPRIVILIILLLYWKFT